MGKKEILRGDEILEELYTLFKISIKELRMNIPEWEMEMYCEKLGITKEQLINAIKKK